MLARGDQVRLTHGRGVGLVISNHDGASQVFIGRDAWNHPKIEEYVDCELMYTGKHFGRAAREIAHELARKTTARVG